MRTAALLPTARRAFLLALTLPLLAVGTLPGTAHAQRSGTTISTSVPGAPAGAEVTVELTGLAPDMPFQLGFGGLSSNHEILARGSADSEGRFSIVVKVPDWVERHRTYRFFLNYVGQPPRGLSDPFIATAADGFVRVAGSVTAPPTNGCAVVTGFDETVYTLLGATGPVESGARVVVEGTLATPDPGVPAPAGCAQGPSIPVRVRQILPG